MKFYRTSFSCSLDTFLDIAAASPFLLPHGAFDWLLARFYRFFYRVPMVGARKESVMKGYVARKTPSDWIFADYNGEPIHPQSVSQAFERIVNRADVPALTLHELRHTHATLLHKERVPLKVVTERLGHANPAYTMAAYQHVLPGMQANAATTFQQLIKPK